MACIAACFMACKKAPPKQPAEPSPETSLTLIAEVSNTKTRTQHSDSESGLALSWAKGDKVGLYVVAENEPEAANVGYKADAAAAKSAFTALSEEAEWKDEISQHSFYAYYPYSESAGADYSKVSVTVPSAQTQSKAGSTEHLAALDFMYAAKKNIARPSDGGVELTFSHPFSVLGLTLTAAEGTALTVDGIILRSQQPDGVLAAEGAKIDLSAGKLNYDAALTSNQITLTLAEPMVLTDESSCKTYMQIIPGHAGRKLDVIAVVGGEERLLVTESIPAAGIPSGVIASLSLSVDGDREDPGPIAVKIVAPEGDDVSQLKDIGRWNGWE